MVIAVLADEGLKSEFLSRSFPEKTEIIWADSLRSMQIIEADIFFDLLFEYDRERIAHLKKLLPKPVIVNSVIHTIGDIGCPFVRINAWPTMLKRPAAEIAALDESAKRTFEMLNWSYSLVPDIAGMVTPRIVSMIINEAWYTYGDQVSTKEEIDMAMRLGTNYPMGPFEWGDKIGLEKIINLLAALGQADSRYTISPAMLKQMNR